MVSVVATPDLCPAWLLLKTFIDLLPSNCNIISYYRRQHVRFAQAKSSLNSSWRECVPAIFHARSLRRRSITSTAHRDHPTQLPRMCQGESDYTEAGLQAFCSLLFT